MPNQINTIKQTNIPYSSRRKQTKTNQTAKQQNNTVTSQYNQPQTQSSRQTKQQYNNKQSKSNQYTNQK